MSAKVQAWFDALPEERQDRAERVRELLMDASPTMTEEWKYNIPFFCNGRRMCYLSLQKNGLVVRSVDGIHLLDVDGLFAPTEHKLIRHVLPPPPPARLNEGALRCLIGEAASFSAQRVKQRKSRPRH